MKVSISAPGRFHYFELARELNQRHLLAQQFTGYPKWKLQGTEKVDQLQTFPWVHTPFMASASLHSQTFAPTRLLDRLNRYTFDHHVANQLRPCDVFTAISGFGLHSGQTAQRMGAKYVCDRGSTHILEQNTILVDEHKTWGLPFAGIDSYVLEKEMAEYAAADLITVPSEFAKQTFIKQGSDPNKVVAIPLGVDLTKFTVKSRPSPDAFTICFAGGVTLRKGVQYLVQAFSKLAHPHKKLKLIGQVDQAFVAVLKKKGIWHPDIELVGHVPQANLCQHFNDSHVLVLPSVEDGFGLVVPQALACGCPVITTSATGAAELIQHGENGFVVPSRNVQALVDALQTLADTPEPDLWRRLAADSVKQLGGWQQYGEQIAATYKGLSA